MPNSNLSLYIELNNYDVIFYTVESEEQNSLKIIYEKNVSLINYEKDKILDFDKIFNMIVLNMIVKIIPITSKLPHSTNAP